MKTPNAITLKDILRTRFDELTARFRRPKAAESGSNISAAMTT